jgi:hypothetical protein
MNLETTPNQKQEVFNRVATHMLTQMKRSMRYKMCAYRGDNGLKCAVGCLISDENYCPTIEDKTVSSHEVRSRVEATLGTRLEETTTRLLRNMQQIHDNTQPSDWFIRLYNLAVNHGLKTDAIDRLLPINHTGV